MSDTDGLAAETRRLLDAATELTAEWYIERTYNKRVPDHWSVDVLSDDDHVCSVRGGDEGAHALAALIAAAPRLLANWLAREDTDVLSVYPDLVLQLRSLSDRSCNAAADIIEQLAAERDEAERRERVAIDITKNMEAILMILLDREGGSTAITDAEVVAVDRRRHIESYRTDLDWNITVRVAAADRGVTDRNPT